MVEISPTAILEIERIRANKHPDSCLRLSVEKGGCRGLVYSLKLEEPESVLKDSASPNDRLVEIAGITLKIDAESWKYSEHLKLDYSEDLMGGGFRFNNPQITDSCGCGISFAMTKSN